MREELMFNYEKYSLNQDKTKYANILVGTSLTQCLKTFEPNTSKLSGGGADIFETLNYINESNHIPSIIAIESNMIFLKGFNKTNYHKSSFNSLKRKLTLLQEQNKPFASLNDYLLMKHIRKHLLKSKPSKKDLNNQKFKKTKQIQNIVDFRNTINEQLFFESKQALNFYLPKLEKKGIKIVFFYTPMDQVFSNCKLDIITKKELLNSYGNKYHILDIEQIIDTIPLAKFQTKDGIHLTKEAGELYGSLLSKKLNTIYNEN